MPTDEQVHVLVDLENVQPPAALLDELAPGFADAWIFHGPHQQKLSQTFKTLIGGRATLVPITRTGNNALDFHLSFYLGYVAAKHPDARLVVIANDKGYEPMIEHAVALGFEVRREGYAAAKKTAPPLKKAATPKKSAAKKIAVPAKKAVAKKATKPKKKPAATMAAPSKKLVAAKDSSVPARLRRVAKAFGKMGAERPQKKASFLRHLEAMLGKDASEATLAEAVAHLKRSSIVAIDGDKVTYLP
ncbi:PIN domain-containing protein [Variovorax sp. DXTD-1]|uniref:PIN domain-containing protein n=1 Tax=Variovorax sp. DXTD-1 TaxID=2495592 RepID=UPI00163B7069|nr:PIN domain-containing protein [Variovorax sp. DXTD-1]